MIMLITHEIMVFFILVIYSFLKQQQPKTKKKFLINIS